MPTEEKNEGEARQRTPNKKRIPRWLQKRRERGAAGHSMTFDPVAPREPARQVPRPEPEPATTPAPTEAPTDEEVNP